MFCRDYLKMKQFQRMSILYSKHHVKELTVLISGIAVIYFCSYQLGVTTVRVPLLFEEVVLTGSDEWRMQEL